MFKYILLIMLLTSCTSYIVGKNCVEVGRDSTNSKVFQCEEF